MKLTFPPDAESSCICPPRSNYQYQALDENAKRLYSTALACFDPRCGEKPQPGTSMGDEEEWQAAMLYCLK